MIHFTRDEYRDGSLAVRKCKVTFFGVKLYEATITSTNNSAVRQLTPITEKSINIKGFNNETKS